MNGMERLLNFLADTDHSASIKGEVWLSRLTRDHTLPGIFQLAGGYTFSSNMVKTVLITDIDESGRFHVVLEFLH